MSATVIQFAARRALLGFDREAIKARVAHDFAAGHQQRCQATAAELERLAAEIRAGQHGELVLVRAAALIALRKQGQP